MKEMSDQVRGVLFVIASLLILFAWGHFYKPPVAPTENTFQSNANCRASERVRNGAGRLRRRRAVPRRARAAKLRAGRKQRLGPRVRRTLPWWRRAEKKLWWCKARCIAWNYRIAAAW